MKKEKKTKKKEESFLYLMSNVGYCIKFLYKANKGMFFIRIPLIIVESASNFISIIFMRYILNEITVDRNMAMVLYYVVGMVGCIFAADILKLIIGRIDRMQSEKTLHKIKLVLGEAVMKLKYSDLESPRIKNFIEVATYSNPFFEVLGNCTAMAVALLNVLGLFAIIMTVSPWIFFLIAFAVIVRIARDTKFRNRQYRYKHDKSSLDRKNKYIYDLAMDTKFGKEIRVNRLEKWAKNKFNTLIIKFVIPLERKIAKETIRIASFEEGFFLLQDALVYLYLAYRVVFHGMLIGDFTMYFTSIKNFSDYVGGFVGNYLLLAMIGLNIQDFRFCMDLAQKQDEKAENISLQDFSKENFSIEFKNVSFKYPNTEKMILKNISIKLDTQKSLSIVGVNGVGKTTFMKLICRFYEPTEGEILLNGIPIETIPYECYIKLIGVVFQDFKLFAFSVKENIVMGMDFDTLLFQKSIDESGLKEKIGALPMGIETMISKEFNSEGIEFSGGEGQKLAIARAIYKSAPLVILDEPTSALDPIAEYDIYNHLAQLSNGKCTVYISHRLSSTRFTDKVAVFSDGYLAEYGNHKELMQIEDGIYKNMFEMQAKYYRGEE